MPTRVYKYVLSPTTKQTIEMAAGAEVLSVGVQGNDIVIWAKVYSRSPLVDREVLIYGTGHDMDEHSNAHHKFVGTVSLHGHLWFHVFVGGESRR